MKQQVIIIVDDSIDALPKKSTKINSDNDYFTNFLHQIHDQQPLPHALIYALENSLTSPCCIATPVHITTSHNDAMITAYGHELEMTNEECEALFTCLKDFLKQDGFNAHMYQQCLWLFESEKTLTLATQTVMQMAHHSMHDLLPKNEFWRCLFTEVQMLFYNHPLNVKRRQQGIPDVNGIWFWGQAKSLKTKPQLNVFTNNKTIKTYCQHLNISVDELSKLRLDNKKHNLIVVDEPSAINLDHLKKHDCVWYWNNLAYRQNKPWWKRSIF